MDELAQKDLSFQMTQAEYFGYRKNWWISLNSGKTVPVRDRSDFNDAFTKNLESNNWGHCHSGSIKNGTNHRVGGNGAIPHQTHNNSKKVHKWAYVQSDMIERWDPLIAVFGKNPRRAAFKIFFVAVRSFTADGGLLQPTGCVKTTPHTSIFAVRISTRNSRTGQKVNKLGALKKGSIDRNYPKVCGSWA